MHSILLEEAGTIPSTENHRSINELNMNSNERMHTIASNEFSHEKCYQENKYLDAEMNQLRTQFEEAQSNWMQEMDVLKKHNTELQHQVETFESEHQKIRKQELAAQEQSWLIEKETLMNQYIQIQRELNQAHSIIQEYQNKIETDHKISDEPKTSHATQTVSVPNEEHLLLSSEMAKLKVELEERKQHEIHLQSTISSSTTQLLQAQAEKARVERELELAHQAAAAANAQLNNLRQQLQK